MNTCYICKNPISTKGKRRVTCKCGAKYRILRNVKIVNSKGSVVKNPILETMGGAAITGAGLGLGYKLINSIL